MPDDKPYSATKTGTHCSATKGDGTPCRNPVIVADGKCIAHQPVEDQRARGFGGYETGVLGGRPKNPTIITRLRERIDAELDDYLKVIEDGIKADKSVVVGNGPSAYLEHVPDHAARLAALREALDRAYGKPTQITEVSGPDGSPVATGLVLDPAMSAEALDLLARAARPREE